MIRFRLRHLSLTFDLGSNFHISGWEHFFTRKLLVKFLVAWTLPVLSPGFVARRGKDGNGELTVDFRTGCSSCSTTYSFVTNAVLIERAVSCWQLHQLISQTTQYLDSWLSDLLQSEVKMKLLEVEGARAPVPLSWRRHCRTLHRQTTNTQTRGQAKKYPPRPE